MFSRKPNPQIDELNAAITQVHAQLADETPESEAFKEMTERLSTLYDQIAKIERRLSPDTLAAISANLLGILLVTQHERAHVIGGKAITFVKQLKS